MTTKVKIEIVQKHMPVVIEVLRSDGMVQHTQALSEIGAAASEYVHSGQTLRVREMTTEEAHHVGFTPAVSDADVRERWNRTTSGAIGQP